jgi:pimeloyl-ACP methyl ester carboxylesterase
MKYLSLSNLSAVLCLSSSFEPATAQAVVQTNGLPYCSSNVTLPDGIQVFYREAGPSNGTTLLLLHGFPSSSHQFRNFMPLLASHGYHVIAPDYPGYGFTVVPSKLNYTYTFASITSTVAAFLDAKNITKFIPYMHDYGAPVGFRLALRRPDSILGFISQNGNAYIEGFGQTFWPPTVYPLWNASTPAQIAAASAPINNSVLTLATTKLQYTAGSQHPELIAPEAYWLDYSLINDQPGNRDIQIGLLRDYRTNVPMYSQWHQYFRQRQPKLLAAWGQNDFIFVPPGAKAFKQDLPNAQVTFLDAGHFLLETNLAEMMGIVLTWLKKNGF